MIDSRVYYYLINKGNNKALSFKNIKDSSKQNALFVEISGTSLEEVWMLQKTHFEGAYFLAHCLTGLVLEKNKNKLELHHQHEKHTQYFLIVQSSIADEEAWIKEYTQPTNLLCFDKALTLKKAEGDNLQAVWKLKRVGNNDIIDNSCIISCLYSGFVMQASARSGEKEGKTVQKSSWVGMLNQRWEVKKVNAFFTIRNLKSGLLVSLSEKKIKDGNSVILAVESNSYHYQLWSLQERGYNTFSIKTANHEELYIGSKDHNLEEGSEIILVKNEYKNLWRVVGPILI